MPRYSAFGIVHVGIVGGERDRSIGLPEHFGFVVGPGVAPSDEIIIEVGFGASSQSLGVVGVNLERALEQGPRLMDAVAVFLRACSKQVEAAHRQIDGVRIFGTSALFGFGLDQCAAQGCGPIAPRLHLAA